RPSVVRPSDRDAVGAFGLLAGRVRADGRTEDDQSGVDLDRSAAHLHREAIETARSRATLLLADAAVLRAVARTLEPLRCLAPRDAAAEVHALLVQRDIARLHPWYDRRR